MLLKDYNVVDSRFNKSFIQLTYAQDAQSRLTGKVWVILLETTMVREIPAVI